MALQVSIRRFLVFLCLLGCSPSWAQSLEGLVLAPGFEADVVYTGNGLHQPGAMDLDPLSGDLFIDDREAPLPNGRRGHIVRINLAQGTLTELIQVSNGFSLNFAADGTLYFSVGNFLLAKWDRTRNTFRKFAIIPGVRGIINTPDGRLFVGEGSYGPAGLYPDSVLQVDPKTGHFQPVFLPDEASQDTGRLYNALSAIAIDEQGGIFAVYKTGLTVKKIGDNYAEFNSRKDLVGGLNQTPMYSRDGLVYQYDYASGTLFAYDQNHTHVIAHGEAISGSFSEFSGMTTDGRNIYLVGDYRYIVRIRASATQTVRQTLETDRGQATLRGFLRDEKSGAPLAGAQLQFNGRNTVTTDANGAYAVALTRAPYEVKVTQTGYLESRFVVDLSSGDLNKDLLATTGLPTWVAPGLQAEVWASPAEGIVSSADVHSDHEGNVYSMNIDAARITKHLRDPATGAHLHAYEFAFGDGLAGAWSLTTDQNLNVYTSNGNDGVFKFPTLPNEEAHVLTAEPGRPGVVRNQYGSLMPILNTRDVDGFGVLSDGSLVINSGTGGEPSPPCNPEGTVDTTLRLLPGQSCPQVLSRGTQCSNGEKVTSNPDLMRVDASDRIWLANRNGNVVRIDSATGCVDWVLLSNSDGIPQHRLGSYTAPVPDPHGNLFLRGARFEPAADVIRLYHEGQFYNVVVGTRQGYGGATFPAGNAHEMIYCDGDTLIRIFTTDGSPIADVVRANVIPE